MSARDHAGSETSGQEHGGAGINHNYVNSSQYFIGNLPRNTTERDVVEFFAKYGPIMHFNMCRTADGRTRGFGWLRFTKIVPDLKERGPYKMQNNVLTVEIAHDKPLSEVKKQHGRNTGTRTRTRGGHRGANVNNSAGTTNVTMNRDSGVHEAAQPQDNAASHRRVGGRRREREPSERGQTRHHSRPHHRHHSKDHHHHRGTRSPTAAAAQLQPQGQPRQRRSASSYSGSSSIASISSYTSSRSRSSESYASTRSGRSRERNGPPALRRREEPYHDVTQPAPASMPHAPLQAPAQAPPMSGFPSQQQQRPLVNAMPSSSIMRPGQPGLAGTGPGAAMPPFAASLAQNNAQVNPFDTGFSSSRPPAVPFPQLNAGVPTNTHLAANNPSSMNTSSNNNMNNTNTNSSSSGGNVGPASQPSPAPASEMFVCLPMALCPPQFLCDPRVFTARLDRTRVGALTICGSVLQTFPMPETTITTTTTGHTGGFGAKAENVSSYGGSGLNSSSATFANSDAFASGPHPPPPPPPPKSIMRPPMQAPPSDLDMRNRMR